ncbi:hypothetical protein BASA50_008381 [Batrachochytrium salamandrivorans]|uniref:Uncharacterized protein n=1 Tax=Batrachochytrium salamandrivorans TaxID=1357716 RepID=A0ABQ8F4H2_9FUNG|nr:hypothetical protein BASA50_008381 [Batrachochytrium salamandrivorans]
MVSPVHAIQENTSLYYNKSNTMVAGNDLVATSIPNTGANVPSNAHRKSWAKRMAKKLKMIVSTKYRKQQSLKAYAMMASSVNPISELESKKSQGITRNSNATLSCEVSKIGPLSISDRSIQSLVTNTELSASENESSPLGSMGSLSTARMDATTPDELAFQPIISHKDSSMLNLTCSTDLPRLETLSDDYYHSNVPRSAVSALSSIPPTSASMQRLDIVMIQLNELASQLDLLEADSDDEYDGWNKRTVWDVESLFTLLTTESEDDVGDYYSKDAPRLPSAVDRDGGVISYVE